MATQYGLQPLRSKRTPHAKEQDAVSRRPNQHQHAGAEQICGSPTVSDPAIEIPIGARLYCNRKKEATTFRYQHAAATGTNTVGSALEEVMAIVLYKSSHGSMCYFLWSRSPQVFSV